MSPSAGGSGPAGALRVPPAPSPPRNPHPRPDGAADPGAHPSPSSAPAAGSQARDIGMVSLLPPDAPRPPPRGTRPGSRRVFCAHAPLWGLCRGTEGPPPGRDPAWLRGREGGGRKSRKSELGRANRAGGAAARAPLRPRKEPGTDPTLGGSTDPPVSVCGHPDLGCPIGEGERSRDPLCDPPGLLGTGQDGPCHPPPGPGSSSCPFLGTVITRPGVSSAPRRSVTKQSSRFSPRTQKGNPGEMKEVFRISSCGLCASRMDKLQLRFFFSQTTGSVKRKDKYCPGLQPCAPGKPSKDSQARSYFQSKQHRGTSCV